MVDERARIGAADPTYTVDGLAKYRAGIGRRDIAACEHKSADFRCLERDAFKLAVAYALVAGEDDPAALSGPRKPYVVGDASGELLGMPYDRCARLAQRGYDGGAVERLVEKEGKRVRLP